MNINLTFDKNESNKKIVLQAVSRWFKLKKCQRDHIGVKYSASKNKSEKFKFEHCITEKMIAGGLTKLLSEPKMNELNQCILDWGEHVGDYQINRNTHQSYLWI